jgi:spore coat polysaccharide biosynthesis protein SpsF
MGDGIMNIGLVIQARMGSSRLPGKVLMNLCGKSVLLHIIERLKSLKGEHKRIIITSVKKEDNVIEDFCEENSILFFRGGENDVLDRYYQAAKLFELHHIVRLTGDNPLVDANNLQLLIDEHLKNNADYSSNKSEVDSGLPEGVGSEIFTFSALEKSWMEATNDYYREHVDEYILKNPDKFEMLVVRAVDNRSSTCKDLRLTIDTKEDFEFVENVIKALQHNNLEINLRNICMLKERGYL